MNSFSKRRMEYALCSKCKATTKTETMTHCCNPSFIVCLTCKKRSKCSVCTKPYPEKSKCILRCPCSLSKNPPQVRARPLTPIKCPKCKKSNLNCFCRP